MTYRVVAGDARPPRMSFTIAPWDQKQIAVMFADLSRFVAFTETHGDRVAAELVVLNLLTAMPITNGRGGHVVKHLGDGLLAWFPDPAQAVQASVELAAAASDVLPMRIGLHWGDVVWMGNDVIGHTVNVAARLVDLARPGEVLVTAPLRDAAGDVAGVRYGPTSERTAKGVCRPLRVSTASHLASNRSTSARWFGGANKEET
jgi:class 3 adenylate cyclase